MNGAEHQAEAERLLSVIAERPFASDDWSTFTVATAAAAQVHATLALAAATADAAWNARTVVDAIEKQTRAASKAAPQRTRSIQ